jgi:hypothetical protein
MYIAPRYYNDFKDAQLDVMDLKEDPEPLYNAEHPEHWEAHNLLTVVQEHRASVEQEYQPIPYTDRPFTDTTGSPESLTHDSAQKYIEWYASLLQSVYEWLDPMMDYMSVIHTLKFGLNKVFNPESSDYDWIHQTLNQMIAYLPESERPYDHEVPLDVDLYYISFEEAIEDAENKESLLKEVSELVDKGWDRADAEHNVYYGYAEGWYDQLVDRLTDALNVAKI